MYEYTLTVIGVFALLLVLDHSLLQSRVISISNKRLWKTTAVFVAFQLVLDNFFTAQGLWTFDPHRVIGIYVPFIPLENLFFGAELLWFVIVLYQFFRAAIASKSR